MANLQIHFTEGEFDPTQEVVDVVCDNAPEGGGSTVSVPKATVADDADVATLIAALKAAGLAE